MLMIIAAILFVLWLLGFVAFHIAGGLIHILIIAAIIIVLYDLIAGRRRV